MGYEDSDDKDDTNGFVDAPQADRDQEEEEQVLS